MTDRATEPRPLVDLEYAAELLLAEARRLSPNDGKDTAMSETFIHDSELPSELCADPTCPEHAKFGLEGIVAWVERHRDTEWRSWQSADFRRGYDAAVEEIDAIVSESRPVVEPPSSLS